MDIIDMSSMASIWLLLMVTANTFINIIRTIYHFFVGNKLKDKTNE
tara:strand:- start:178 stop:315 length:138 start_codon:yes stop_codon:yes gene_type:complete